MRDNLRPILAEIEKVRRVDKNGKVKFEGFQFNANVGFLLMDLDDYENINSYNKHNFIIQALFEIGKKGPINTKNYSRQLKLIINNYLASPENKYKFITHITIPKDISLPIIKDGGNTITFNPKNISNFISSRLSLKYNNLFNCDINIPKNMATISVSVSGKNDVDAMNKSIESLDYIRGIMNFYCNNKWRISNDYKPINAIRLGPIHSLHHYNGSLASKTFMFNSDYTEDIYNKKINILDSIEKVKLRRLTINRLEYSSDIKNIMIRYVRALDHQDFNMSILELWGLLEYLGDPEKQYSKTAISRASVFYYNKEYFISSLAMIRKIRNKFAHTGKSIDLIENAAYYLKSIVEKLITFYTKTEFKFCDIVEAARFLEILKEPDQIQREIMKMEYASSLGFSNNHK